jgi:predicted phosphodiesterase
MAEFRELNAGDLHIPYHDPYALDLFLKTVEAVRPTAINLIGDLCDFYEVSKFDKDPDEFKRGGLQKALDQWFGIASDIRQAAGPGCELRFIPGNHELRMYKYLCRHQEIADLEALKIPNLMRLAELNITYYENEILVANGNLAIKHGDVVRKESAYSAQGELAKERYALSTLTGHTHRMGCSYVTTRHGIVKGTENGCLCSLKPKYIRNPNWQQGLTQTVHWGGDLFHLDDIPFLGKGRRLKCVVFDQVVKL